MWLYRGAQSAVFYYVTCTPCANSMDRRKRMKDARSQRQKQKLDIIVTDQPRPFPQPTAFSTNQGWMEEITLGPGPPARRGGHRNTQRRTDSCHTDTHSANSMKDVGRIDVSAHKKDNKNSLMQPVSDRWNRMRYQREDEPLWGEEVEVKGSSVGLSGRGRTDVQEPSKYYIARVPPVNDLHPPIVSGPKSRTETRWMLQPPPSAKIMAGKERSTLSVQINRYMEKNVSLAGERSYKLPPISTQKIEEKTLNPSPTLTHPNDSSQTTTGMTKTDQQPIQPLPPAVAPFGRDESSFVHQSTSVDSRCDSLMSTGSESESPRGSMHSPKTPTSRPGSKDTEGYGKQFRSTISKAIPTLPRDSQNKVQLLHLEINESHEEVGLGQFEPIRPWRWSMDI